MGVRSEREARECGGLKMAEHVLFAKMAESHHYVNRQLPLIGDASRRAIRRWNLLLGDGSRTKFRPARIHRDSVAAPQKLGFSDFFEKFSISRISIRMMLGTSENTPVTVETRPRHQRGTRTPQAGGRAPRHTNMKFTIFAVMTRKMALVDPWGRGVGPGRVGGGL